MERESESVCVCRKVKSQNECLLIRQHHQSSSRLVYFDFISFDRVYGNGTGGFENLFYYFFLRIKGSIKDGLVLSISSASVVMKVCLSLTQLNSFSLLVSLNKVCVCVSRMTVGFKMIIYHCGLYFLVFGTPHCTFQQSRFTMRLKRTGRAVPPAHWPGLRSKARSPEWASSTRSPNYCSTFPVCAPVCLSIRPLHT